MAELTLHTRSELDTCLKAVSFSLELSERVVYCLQGLFEIYSRSLLCGRPGPAAPSQPEASLASGSEMIRVG